MAIGNEDAVSTPVLNAGARGITKQMVLDIIDSQYGIGGYMACEDVNNIQLPNNWEAFEYFTFSSDTKGVNEDLLLGQYTITLDISLNDTPDAWAIDFSAGLVFNFDGWVEFAVIKNAQQPGQQIITGGRRRRDFLSGQNGSLNISVGTALKQGDTIGMIVRSSAAGPGDLIDVRDANFRILRG